MNLVPKGWTATTLGNLGRYLNGRAFKKSEWRETGRPIIRIQNLTGSSSSFNYFQGEVEDRYVARPGDLLVSWAATLGAYIWSGPEAVVNQHIFKVESKIDRTFHKYLLDYKLDELMRHTHGSGMVHITRSRFDAVPVVVPALSEQRRVVDILEDHFSRLSAAELGLRAAIARVAALRLSSLATSVSGGSSTGGDQIIRFGSSRIELPRDWVGSTLGDEANLVEYGSSAKAHVDGALDDVPVLRMGNIKDSQIDWSSLKYLPSDHGDLPRLLLRPGDLLFNRTNSAELVGKAAVFGEHVEATFASYLIRVRFSDRVDPHWANMVINSPWGRRYIGSVTSQQVGQANVNGTKLKTFPLPVPPLAEQRRRTAEYRALVDETERSTNEIRTAMQHTEQLRRSVLSAAFSGHLTGRSTDKALTEEMAGV